MLRFLALWSALAASVATFALPAIVFAAPEETISIETLLKAGWQIAGYTSTLDNRSASIIFRHPEESYLVQCRASYDVTRSPAVHSSCYKLLQSAVLRPADVLPAQHLLVARDLARENFRGPC